MKQVVFNTLAFQDFQDIYDYISADNASNALSFIQRLQKRCNDLAQFPNVGRKRGQYRTVTEGDYVIFYRLANPATVEIMRIVHGKRDLRKI